jgi:thioredoxin 1
VDFRAKTAGALPCNLWHVADFATAAKLRDRTQRRLLVAEHPCQYAIQQSRVPTMTGANFAVLNEQNFDSEVLRHPGLAVVDFWSENCVPCKQLTRVLSQLSAEIPTSVRIGTVKVNDNLELAARLGIQGTPTLLFFKGGALVDSRTGVDRRQVLKKLVETHA